MSNKRFLVLPAPRDITNMRFNHLVAIEKASSRNGNTYWKFKCDCGNEKIIQTGNVTLGLVKTCGCFIGTVRDVSSDCLPNDTTTRECVLCGNEFLGFTGDARVFCYDCSPRGATVAEAMKSKKRAMKHILVEYKGGQCVECGYHQCEGALQFHHINGKDKNFTLTSLHPNEISMDDLRQEADKCELLCANCHIKKHTIDDRVGFIMNLPPNNKLTGGRKQCIVCGSEFNAHHYNRKYCYDCVPYGLGSDIEPRYRKRAVKNELLKYKGKVCQSCGYDENQSVLQLHHRNPNEKSFTFSQINLSHLGLTMDKLKEEADKCDVLCANCHFEVHYNNGEDDIDLD
jgi:hypothetical protein